MRRTVALLVFLATLAPLSVLAGPLEDASAARARGAYDDALGALAGRDVDVRRARADVLMLTGRLDEARDVLLDLVDDGDAAAIGMFGELLVRRGAYTEALERLEPAVEGSASPNLQARYWRAEAFDNTGRPSRATLEHEDTLRAYGRGEVTDAADLTTAARAAMRLGRWGQANEIFRAALAAEVTSVDVRLAWAELFLEKYRPDEAETLLNEALAAEPSHPFALAMRARVELELSYDTAQATALAEQALDVYEDMPEALEVLAEIAIDDRRYDDALAMLDRADAVAPSRLELLTLRGAVYYLRDDAEQLDAIEARVLRAAPLYARFYHVIGEFGVRNFRYAEAVSWFQRALDTDANYWRAYVSLGIAYSRMADDARATSFLRRAFDNDPFNVRAYNMVELFEGALADHVVFDDPEVEGLRYRVHAREQAVLGLYLPDAARTAWRTYVERYGLTPPPPVSVEVFADPEVFSVRSVGVPAAGQHGICFGHVVTARSPNTGDFNWRNVIEHEMSHVFSLTASNYRVPRWLTEGLAEYDTMLSHPNWRREEELSLVRALQGEGLVGVLGLSAAFVDEDIEKILAAYFQASLVVEFIGQRWGYDHILGLLYAYRDGANDAEALTQSLDVSAAEFDGLFEAHIREMLGPMVALYEPSLSSYRDVDALVAAARTHPDDADRQAEAAAALWGVGDVDGAVAGIEAALALDARQPLANFLKGSAALQAGDATAATRYLEAVLGPERDSYTVRMALGEAARLQGNDERAREHFERAAALYPRSPVPPEELAELARLRRDRTATIAMLERVAELDENGADAPLALVPLMIEDRRYDDALRYAAMALDVAPFDRDVHQAYGHAAYAAGSWELVVRELELELSLGAADRETSMRRLLEAYQALGRDDDAARMLRSLGE